MSRADSYHAVCTDEFDVLRCVDDEHVTRKAARFDRLRHISTAVTSQEILSYLCFPLQAGCCVSDGSTKSSNDVQKFDHDEIAEGTEEPLVECRNFLPAYRSLSLLHRCSKQKNYTNFYF